MSEPVSSSNRHGGTCDAVLQQRQHAVGPMRLPESRASDFIADFNRIYGAVGMSLAPAPPQDNVSPQDNVTSQAGKPSGDGEAPAVTESAKKIPGNPKVAGDDF